MTLPPVRPAPPETTPLGYTPSYVSPHGHLEGLRARLAGHIDRLGRDKTLPWVGLGIIRDLEVTVQLLNMREFAEWLRTQGDPAHQRFGDEILEAQGILDGAGYATPSLVANVDGLDDENRENDAKALVLADVRQVLVSTGALASDDHETPLPALVRALLS